MLKEYTISIVTSMENKEHIGWLVGESECLVDIPYLAFSKHSFHVERKEMTQLVFSEKKSDARMMTPKNMQSWLDRVLAFLPYADIDVKEIRITEESDEKDRIASLVTPRILSNAYKLKETK
jgi:hypothetical protein